MFIYRKKWNEKNDSAKTGEGHNGGSTAVAAREGGGGVVGEPHSNSEEQQTRTYGRPDSNCSGPTKILMYCSPMFTMYYVFV